MRIAPGVRGQGSRHGSAVRVHCVFCDIWGFLCFFGVNNASITDYVLEENNSKTRQHDATGRKCSGEGGADVDFPQRFMKPRRPFVCLRMHRTPLEIIQIGFAENARADYVDTFPKFQVLSTFLHADVCPSNVPSGGP